MFFLIIFVLLSSKNIKKKSKIKIHLLQKQNEILSLFKLSEFMLKKRKISASGVRTINLFFL